MKLGKWAPAPALQNSNIDNTDLDTRPSKRLRKVGSLVQDCQTKNSTAKSLLKRQWYHCKSIVLKLIKLCVQTESLRFNAMTTMLMFQEKEAPIKGGGGGKEVCCFSIYS